MTQFIAFALYLCFGVATLIIWPVMLHPTLPPLRKLLISMLAFIIIVPVGVALYAWLGVPQLAAQG